MTQKQSWQRARNATRHLNSNSERGTKARALMYQVSGKKKYLESRFQNSRLKQPYNIREIRSDIAKFNRKHKEKLKKEYYTRLTKKERRQVKLKDYILANPSDVDDWSQLDFELIYTS